jgi:sugar (pentulose or hexulose) kinase
MSLFLGVDAGTTAMKAGLFDLDGHALAIASQEYSLETPHPAWVEMNPEIYWQTCCQAVRRVLEQSRAQAKDVRGLAISSQGETLIALDAAGKPTRKAIVWLDNRAAEQSEALRKDFSQAELFEVTGQPDAIPTWPACKLRWMRENEPETFAHSRYFMLLEDYLAFRMTGERIAGTALHTSSLFLDIRTRQWWQPMLTFAGIEESQLGRLTDPGEKIGELSEQGAAAMGLAAGIPLVCGGMDQVVSAVGAGNTAPGVFSETTGTALVALVTFDQPAYDPAGKLPCHVHAAPGKYAVMPWCQTAGMALRWFRDEFFGLEAEMALAAGRDPYDEMTRLAAETPPGAAGLRVLPHLEGAVSPEYDPDARAVFYGATLRHGRGHFVRGIMESVAFMLRKNLALIEAMGLTVSEVRSLGGAARSRLWLQIKADVLQKPIVTLENEETSLLGAALIAATAAGEFRSLEEGAARMVRVRERILPEPANAVIYERAYREYLELYNRLQPLFQFTREEA